MFDNDDILVFAQSASDERMPFFGVKIVDRRGVKNLNITCGNYPPSTWDFTVTMPGVEADHIDKMIHILKQAKESLSTIPVEAD